MVGSYKQLIDRFAIIEKMFKLVYLLLKSAKYEKPLHVFLVSL